MVENTTDTDNVGQVNWSFTPDAAAFRALAQGQTATQTGTITVTDIHGAAVSTEVSVALTGVNDAPVAGGDSLGSTLQDTQRTIATATLLANDSDPDGDALTVVSVGNALNGTVVLTGDGVVFTPASGFTGQARFEYVVADGKGGTATATALLQVEAPPVTKVEGDHTQADYMIGGPGPDWFDGNGRDDILMGMGGADTLWGGHGRDAIYGGDGDDVIGAALEDEGDDFIYGGRGDDQILDGDGKDTYHYWLGDGRDSIDDRDSSGVPVDVLKLVDINPDGVTLRISGTSLIIVVEATDDHPEGEIVLLNQLDPTLPNFGIEEIQFADGTVWDDGYFETLAAASSASEAFPLA